MDELQKLLSEKFGLDEAASKQAIETVAGFLKDKLPPNVGGLIDGALSGEGGDGGGLLDSAKGALGGLMGGDDD